MAPLYWNFNRFSQNALHWATTCLLVIWWRKEPRKSAMLVPFEIQRKSRALHFLRLQYTLAIGIVMALGTVPSKRYHTSCAPTPAYRTELRRASASGLGWFLCEILWNIIVFCQQIQWLDLHLPTANFHPMSTSTVDNLFQSSVSARVLMHLCYLYKIFQWNLSRRLAGTRQFRSNFPSRLHVRNMSRTWKHGSYRA